MVTPPPPRRRLDSGRPPEGLCSSYLRPMAESARHELCADPLIYFLDGFASDAECGHLIERATTELEPALVEADGDGTLRPAVRTGSSCWLAARGDAVLERLEDRICGVVGCREEATEFFQVVRYRAGTKEQYKPHLDAHDLSTPRGKRATARGGQRLVTALLYLNTVGGSGGGCTVFSELGVRCSPQRGRLLVFHNCRPGSRDADPRLRHAGEPVGKGGEDKWICNKWIREAPLRARRSSMMAHLYGEPAVVAQQKQQRRAAPAPTPASAPAAASSPSTCGTGDGPQKQRARSTAEDTDDRDVSEAKDGASATLTSSPQTQPLLAAARAWKRQRLREPAADTDSEPANNVPCDHSV